MNDIDEYAEGIRQQAAARQQHDEKYPEHVKLRAIQHQSQTVKNFIDWLREEKGYFIAQWYNETQACTVAESDLVLLAEHFDIDLNKIEEEKRAMVDELRAGHEADDGA